MLFAGVGRAARREGKKLCRCPVVGFLIMSQAEQVVNHRFIRTVPWNRLECVQSLVDSPGAKLRLGLRCSWLYLFGCRTLLALAWHPLVLPRCHKRNCQSVKQ